MLRMHKTFLFCMMICAVFIGLCSFESAEGSTVTGETVTAEDKVYQDNLLMRQKEQTAESVQKHFLRIIDSIEDSINEAKIGEITSFAVTITKDCKTDMEKLKVIHDWVAENIYYDYYGVNNDTEVRSAWDVFEKRGTVCEGYSNLTAVMCRSVGIPCKVITGYGRESCILSPSWTQEMLDHKKSNHAWNEAYIDGRWVILDTTWDSSNENSKTDSKVQYGACRYDYFDPDLKTFSKDHLIIDIKEMEISNSTEGYFLRKLNPSITNTSGKEIVLSWDVTDYSWSVFEIYNSSDYTVQCSNEKNGPYTDVVVVTNDIVMSYSKPIDQSLFTSDTMYFRIFVTVFDEKSVSDVVSYTLTEEDKKNALATPVPSPSPVPKASSVPQVKKTASEATQTKTKSVSSGESVNLGRAVMTKCSKYGRGMVKLKWKKVSNAIEYQIQYSVKKNFKKRSSEYSYSKSKVVFGLKSKKTYYFRVRAASYNNGKKLYGAWSKARKVKVK